MGSFVGHIEEVDKHECSSQSSRNAFFYFFQTSDKNVFANVSRKMKTASSRRGRVTEAEGRVHAEQLTEQQNE